MASAADDGSDLTDRIYEAAFVPEFWSDVLGMLGGLSGSPSGSFFVFDDIKPIRFEATELVYAINESFCSTGLWRQSQRIPYYQQNPMTGFVIGQEYYPADFLDADSSYVERRKLGLEGHAGTIIPMPTGEMIAIAIEKWAGDGPFTADDIDKLDIYYSHLARAGLMAARLGLEQARATASALQAIGLPAAVMSSSGRVKATNKLFDEMGAMFLPVAFGGMAIADPAANQLFQQAIVAVGTDTGGAVRSIPVKAKGDDPPVIIHVLPLRRSAHDIFSGADIIVAATAVSPSALVPTPTILTGLFDLAPSEARLAVALTQGRALKAFASEAGITFSTAREISGPHLPQDRNSSAERARGSSQGGAAAVLCGVAWVLAGNRDRSTGPSFSARCEACLARSGGAGFSCSKAPREHSPSVVGHDADNEDACP